MVLGWSLESDHQHHNAKRVCQSDHRSEPALPGPVALAACNDNDPNADPGRLPLSSESIDGRIVRSDGVGGGSGTGAARMRSNAHCCCNASAWWVVEFMRVQSQGVYV